MTPKARALEEAIAAAGEGAVPPPVAAALRAAVASGGTASVAWEPLDWRGDAERVAATAVVLAGGDVAAALAAAGFVTPPGTRGASWAWSGPLRAAAANDGPVRVDLSEDGGVVLKVVGENPVEIIFNDAMAARVSRKLAGAAAEVARCRPPPLVRTGSGGDG